MTLYLQTPRPWTPGSPGPPWALDPATPQTLDPGPLGPRLLDPCALDPGASVALMYTRGQSALLLAAFVMAMLRAMRACDTC